MANIDTEIRFVKKWKKEEIVNLYKAGGWWKESYDSSLIKSIINGSYAFAVVVDKSNGKAVGMGRILSDGISDAYIQDLVTLSNYRDLGIGKKLVKFLIDKCLSNGISWIALIAEPGQSEFYYPLGFQKMKDYIAMKFKTER